MSTLKFALPQDDWQSLLRDEIRLGIKTCFASFAKLPGFPIITSRMPTIHLLFVPIEFDGTSSLFCFFYVFVLQGYTKTAFSIFSKFGIQEFVTDERVIEGLPGKNIQDWLSDFPAAFCQFTAYVICLASM